MVFDRRTAAQYLLPIGSMALALALRLGAKPAEHAALPIHVLLGALVIILVFATVFAVVHHAEKVAHRLGEPYGTLVLTAAVTIIEASVIVSMMLHGENNPELARESVFSTVMIVCGGIVGICLTVGGWRHHYQDIKRQGTSAFLAVLIALAVLILILPNFTLTSGPGTFSALQLGFVSLLSLLLYGSFVFAQMGRHRDDFVENLVAETTHADRAGAHEGIAANVVLLIVGLAGIVLAFPHRPAHDRRRPGRHFRAHARRARHARRAVPHHPVQPPIGPARRCTRSRDLTASVCQLRPGKPRHGADPFARSTSASRDRRQLPRGRDRPARP